MKYSTFTYKGYSFIDITNSDNFRVVLSTLGASIYSIHLDNLPMCLVSKSLDDFLLPNYYHGKTIGRTSNRIKGNVIKINDKEFSLLNNEGENTLHGGVDGISTKNFIYQITPGLNSCLITFTYLSKNGESGYPGNLALKVNYTVYEHKDYIDVEYCAITDEDTLCSLTNHAYYSLGESSCLNLKLKINASNFLETCEKDLIAIDKKEVPDCLDFRTSKEIGKDLNDPYLINHRSKGYDHFFYFDNHDISFANVSIESKKYLLNIYTNFSGTQIYSYNYETPFHYENTNEHLHAGIAIEPSDEFKTLHVLKKNEKYSRFIRFAFSRKSEL